jgi:2-dehydro-3-deoxy-D-arabinonate dehydratase
LKIYRTAAGPFAEADGEFRALAGGLDLDLLFASADPADFAETAFVRGRPAAAPTHLLAPLQSQEVWAAGVTYLRSRVARVAESKDAGGAGRPTYFAAGSEAQIQLPAARRPEFGDR